MMINQTVQILIFKCNTKFRIRNYLKRTGTIKGLKKTFLNQYIYLIEFDNGSRIWATSKEFKPVL